jgi:hypothetical protein
VEPTKVEGVEFGMRELAELAARGGSDLTARLSGLIPVLRWSPERLKLAAGDRRDDQA